MSIFPGDHNKNYRLFLNRKANAPILEYRVKTVGVPFGACPEVFQPFLGISWRSILFELRILML